MTLQWIPLDSLEPHPENANRMPRPLMDKLKRHIQRTGLYEPLVVRPLRIADCGMRIEQQEQRPADPSSAIRQSQCRYQILNGHHRAEVLRELGHTHARCDVWEVDEGEARVLLATLNRLEGRDDPSARASLVARLLEGRSAEDLSRLLPEPPDALERLRRLAEPPPAPADPAAVAPPVLTMTFFLTEEQHALVAEALRQCGARGADGGAAKRPNRSTALERLAQWYLEACGRR